MIEKLEQYTESIDGFWDIYHPNSEDCIDKINELIDAMNELKKRSDEFANVVNELKERLNESKAEKRKY